MVFVWFHLCAIVVKAFKALELEASFAVFAAERRRWNSAAVACGCHWFEEDNVRPAADLKA